MLAAAAADRLQFGSKVSRHRREHQRRADDQDVAHRHRGAAGAQRAHADQHRGHQPHADAGHQEHAEPCDAEQRIGAEVAEQRDDAEENALHRLHAVPVNQRRRVPHGQRQRQVQAHQQHARELEVAAGEDLGRQRVVEQVGLGELAAVDQRGHEHRQHEVDGGDDAQHQQRAPFGAHGGEHRHEHRRPGGPACIAGAADAFGVVRVGHRRGHHQAQRHERYQRGRDDAADHRQDRHRRHHRHQQEEQRDEGQRLPPEGLESEADPFGAGSRRHEVEFHG